MAHDNGTRNKLVNAAIECLAEEGFAQLTFVRVCEKSGFTRGAAHYHFASLEDLLLAAVKEIGARLKDLVMSGFEGQDVGTGIYKLCIERLHQQQQSVEFRAMSHVRAALSTNQIDLEKVLAVVREIHDFGYEQFDLLVKQHLPDADPTVGRVILAAVTGMSLVDNAIGTPADDKKRQAFKSTLTRLVTNEI